jgi:hypothetical protein
MLEIPVVVNPVDDPVIINSSAWDNLTLLEDETMTLDLAAMAYDVDGDGLTWTFEGGTNDLSVMQVNGSMVFTPRTDFFGVVDEVWLNVSDGSSTHSASLSVMVQPVPDLPFVNIESVQSLGGSTANMYWSVVDVDGVVSTDANVSVDNVNVVVNHSCLSSSGGVYQCVTLLPITAGSTTSMYIELEIYDADLDRSVLATRVFDPSVSNNTNGDQSGPAGDDAGGLSGVVLASAGLGLLGLLVAVLFLRQRQDGDVSIMPAAVEDEPTEEVSGGGGLLARANRLK